MNDGAGKGRKNPVSRYIEILFQGDYILAMIRNKRIMERTVKTRIYELQAEICQALANPKRLEIISLLENGELSAGEIVKAMGLPEPNVSQHLSVMRQKGIIVSRREGTSIFYRLSSTKIIEACSTMKEVLVGLLKGQEALSKNMQKIEDK